MLEVLDQAASIATAVVAVVFFGGLKLDRWKKRRALEKYLLDQTPGSMSPSDRGLRTAIHLMAALKMTEEEILHAAFGSAKVKIWTSNQSGTSRAGGLLFQHATHYREGDESKLL